MACAVPLQVDAVVNTWRATCSELSQACNAQTAEIRDLQLQIAALESSEHSLCTELKACQEQVGTLTGTLSLSVLETKPCSQPAAVTCPVALPVLLPQTARSTSVTSAPSSKACQARKRPSPQSSRS